MTFHQPLNHTSLLYFLFTCCGIVLISYGILMYAVIKERESDKLHFHRSLGFELLWTTIPFIIVVLLAYPAIIELIQR